MSHGRNQRSSLAGAALATAPLGPPHAREGQKCVDLSSRGWDQETMRYEEVAVTGAAVLMLGEFLLVQKFPIHHTPLTRDLP